MSNETLILVALVWSGLSYIASLAIAGLLSHLVIGDIADTIQTLYPQRKLIDVVLAIKEVKPKTFWIAYIGYYMASFAINGTLIYLGLSYFSTFSAMQIDPLIFALAFLRGRLLLMVILDIRSLVRSKNE